MMNKELTMTNSEAIDIIKCWAWHTKPDEEDIEQAIKVLEQQQKVGRWIKTYEPNDAEPFILWECSECQNTERGRRSKYCPNCGIQMEESEE